MAGGVEDLQREAMRALEDGEVLDLGTCRVQKSGESYTITIPAEAVRYEGVEKGDEMRMGYHPRTGGIAMHKERETDDVAGDE